MEHDIKNCMLLILMLMWMVSVPVPILPTLRHSFSCRIYNTVRYMRNVTMFLSIFVIVLNGVRTLTKQCLSDKWDFKLVHTCLVRFQRRLILSSFHAFTFLASRLRMYNLGWSSSSVCVDVSSHYQQYTKYLQCCMSL